MSERTKRAAILLAAILLLILAVVLVVMDQQRRQSLPADIPVTDSGVADITAFNQVEAYEQVGDEIYRVTYLFTIENSGTKKLKDLIATLNLSPAEWLVEVVSISSASIPVNLGFDGIGDQNLLLADTDIHIGESYLISLVVDVMPLDDGGDFESILEVSGNGQFHSGTVTVSDSSSAVFALSVGNSAPPASVPPQPLPPAVPGVGKGG